jgi:hypothetical protein
MLESLEEAETYNRLRNAKMARDLAEPPAAALRQREQELEMFKFTIGKFTDMISSDKVSPASRDTMKEYLRAYVGAAPPELRMAAAPAIAYSPIDPVAEQLDRFDRTNPMPAAPVTMGANGTILNERTEANEHQWAEYDFAMLERNLKRKLMADKINGINADPKEYAPPKFISGQNNKLWYKDHKTGQVGFIDTKMLPEAEIKTSIEKGWQTFNDILNAGVLVLGEPRYSTMSDTQVELRKVKDIATGKTIIERTPLGPAEGKGTMPPVLDDAFAAFQLGVTSGKEFDKLVPRARGIVTMLKEIDDAKSDPKKQTQLIGTLNKVMQNQYGYILARATNEVENSWAQNWIPGINKYTMAGGVYTAIPVNREMVSFTGVDASGAPKSSLFYYNDVLKMAIDARGKPIESTKGISPNSKEVVPNLQIESPPPKPSGAVPRKQENLGEVIMEDWREFVPKVRDALNKSAPVQQVKNSIENFNLAMIQKSRVITQVLDNINTDADLLVAATINWIRGRGWKFKDKSLDKIIATAEARATETEKDSFAQLKDIIKDLRDTYSQFDKEND